MARRGDVKLTPATWLCPLHGRCRGCGVARNEKKLDRYAPLWRHLSKFSRDERQAMLAQAKAITRPKGAP